ncbi:YadA-like family protein, partial [Chelativorans intermedius]
SAATALGGTSVYDGATQTLTAGLDVDGTTYTNVQDALTAVGATASAGWNLQANGDAASNVAPGGTVQFLDGQNIAITRSGTDITIATAMDLMLDSVTLSGGQVFSATGLAMNGTKVTSLAAGTVSAASTDAVNGGQLYGVSQSVADHLGGGASVNADGTIAGPSYTVQGGSYGTVSDAFAAVDGSLTSISTTVNNINNGTGIKYFRGNSSLADSQANGTDSVAVGPAAVADGESSVAMGNGAMAAGAGSIALGQGASASEANSVALGAGSTTEAAVGTAGTTINGKDYAFAGTAPVGTVSVGTADAERTITNVAAGRISADSTDAVNGSQLHATNQAIEDLESGVGDLNEFAVRYDRNTDGTKANKVTLMGGDPNAPVVLANVAAGVAQTDAVNVRQLDEGMENTLNQANSYTDTRTTWAVEQSNAYTDAVSEKTLSDAKAYTDERLSQINLNYGEVRKEARQAAAIGLAASSLRFDDTPGKLSVAVGAGYWRSAGAFAFGAGYTSENGRVRANLTGTTAGGHWGVGAGLSVTLN